MARENGLEAKLLGPVDFRKDGPRGEETFCNERFTVRRRIHDSRDGVRGCNHRDTGRNLLVSYRLLSGTQDERAGRAGVDAGCQVSN